MPHPMNHFVILDGFTPLEPLPRLAEHLGLKSLWIKRDDLTGLMFGEINSGNWNI